VRWLVGATVLNILRLELSLSSHKERKPTNCAPNALRYRQQKQEKELVDDRMVLQQHQDVRPVP
jgi:hypothetical protein